MGIISKHLRQTAIYWAPAGNDGYGGQDYADPVELDCRFETTDSIVRDSAGNEIVSKSLAYVDQVVLVQGFLKLGELTDLDSSDSDPVSIDDAHEIINFSELPNLRNTETLYTAYM